MDRSADIGIVGGGIVGLAIAYMALRKGHRVVLFERHQQAVGASIRNFGLLWPIGQEPGVGLRRALRSRDHWLEISKQAGLWINQNASLHLAYHKDEWDVLEEFMALYKNDFPKCELLDASATMDKSSMINQANLKGGLWSPTECTVNPREAIRKIPRWLEEKFGLILRYDNVVTEISIPNLKTSRETWRVDKVFLCSGADFETLYPEVYSRQSIVKCKLQMMKGVLTDGARIFGPSLCAGLTLRHYSSFSKCASLKRLDDRYDQESAVLKKYGIHVLLSQNNHDELIIGDSHEYSNTIEPFDCELINELILGYLRSFVQLKSLKVTERWHGVYVKAQERIDLVTEPAPGVTIVNGLGGAGMTLSFGLAEELIEKL